MQLRKVLLPVLLLFSACAQIVTPDGGPKDVTPPKVVQYEPDSAAVNFQGTRIVIRFDEYIALNDLNKQLIISPAVKRRPEVTIRKKDLIIQFKDTLDANTTYSVSFGKAIRDITENNVLTNFQYVFSTGNFIDSLECSGHVVSARTLRPEKGILVMLYRNTGDSVVYKEKPYYYTRTDEQGNFRLTNLAPATYRIFALEDDGDDYLYNSKAERIAFSDSLLTLQSNTDSVRLKLFQEKSSEQFLSRSMQQSPGRFQLSYNQPIKQPSVQFVPALPTSMDPIIEYAPTGDTINIWFAKVELDSVQFVVSSGKTVLDTIPMRLNKPGNKKSGRAGVADARALVLSNNALGGKMIPGNQLVISSTNPIRSLDEKKIVFRRGADTLVPKIETSPNKRTIRFTNEFPEDSSFYLFIPSGALVDWYGQKSDTIRSSFVVMPARQFGNFYVKLPLLSPGKYIVQVVDEKDRVIKDTLVNGTSECRFPLIPAGNYRVRIIYDTNGDGLWTTGNYQEKRQPEKVIYYATPVRIRAGWDMDVEWRLE